MSSVWIMPFFLDVMAPAAAWSPKMNIHKPAMPIKLKLWIQTMHLHSPVAKYWIMIAFIIHFAKSSSKIHGHTFHSHGW